MIKLYEFDLVKEFLDFLQYVHLVCATSTSTLYISVYVVELVHLFIHVMPFERQLVLSSFDFREIVISNLDLFPKRIGILIVAGVRILGSMYHRSAKSNLLD